jgi:hypothetical protein
MVIKAVAWRRWADGRALDEARGERWAASWYEPVATDDAIDRGVHFALSTPGVHGFCTPGDIPLLPRVLDAADRYAGLDEAQRSAAVEAMAGEDVIFPMAG